MSEPYLDRWNLMPDGDTFATPFARLLPMTWRGWKVMLKLAIGEEERAGDMLMTWWDGDDAASVLAHEDRGAPDGACHRVAFALRHEPGKPR